MNFATVSANRCTYNATHYSDKLQRLPTWSKAPTTAAVPAFSRKRAAVNIWEHGPHLHVFAPNETLVCTWKEGFHDVLSTMIVLNLFTEEMLMLGLKQNWYFWASSDTTSIKISVLLLFPVSLNFDRRLKRWNNTHCSWHSSCRVFVLWQYLFFWLIWLSFSYSIRSLMNQLTPKRQCRKLHGSVYYSELFV